MNLKPVLRNVSSKTGLGTVNIYLDFYYKNYREQVFFKTPIKVEKRQFSKAGKIKLHPNGKELNSLLVNELEKTNPQ
ncbi:MAG: hypothetical protein WD607_08330 [Candidatus Paceibacterota bacterium]